MPSNFPGALDSLTNPNGTQDTVTVDHAAQHTNANDAIEATQGNVGTNSGTNILNNFTVGQFPLRVTGGGATGTHVTTLVGGTLANTTLIGTPTINGGTYTSFYISGIPVSFSYVSAYRSTDSGTLPVGTATLVVFDAEDYDLGGNYNNTSGTFIVPAGGAGIYDIYAQVYIYNEMTDQKQYHIGVYKNGTMQKESRHNSSGIGAVLPAVKWQGSLASGDAVSFFATSNSATGSSKVFGNSQESYMSIRQVTRS